MKRKKAEQTPESPPPPPVAAAPQNPPAEPAATLPVTIGGAALGALTGLGDKRHRQLAAEGYFPPPFRGFYQLEATVRGVVRYYREMGQRRRGSLAEEQEMKVRAERQKIELQLARLRGESLDAAEVERAWAGIVMTVRQKFLGLPSKVAPRLPVLQTEVEIQGALEKEVDEILSELGKPMSYQTPSEAAEETATT